MSLCFNFLFEILAMKHSPIRVLKKFTLLFILITVFTKVSAQEWNSARLTVLNGSSIPFNFNSLHTIKDGIEIHSGTQFGISMADSSKVGHNLDGFIVNFRSFNGQSSIKGDVYTLPLSCIRVKAENLLGLNSGISTGYNTLTTNWLPLFTYTKPPLLPWVELNWSTAQLNVSFECGKPVSGGGNGSLMGEEPDYYTLEIEFELIPTGPGF